MMHRSWTIAVALLLGLVEVQAAPARTMRLVLFAPALQVGEEPTFTITAVQQFDCAVIPRDAKGNEAKIDGVPVWTSSDTTLLQLNPSADGMTAHAVAQGPLGTVTITVKADGKLGEGVREISGSVEVNILAGDAVTLELVPAPPIEPPPLKIESH